MKKLRFPGTCKKLSPLTVVVNPAPSVQWINVPPGSDVEPKIVDGKITLVVTPKPEPEK